jgi:integrative and conjugative element protein (TIGR02256 family)
LICSPGQRQALRQLQLIVEESGGAVAVTGPPELDPDGGWLSVSLSLDFGAADAPADLAPAAGRVGLLPSEPVTVHIPSVFPFAHPKAVVPHLRFADQTHVQWGCLLCLYQAPNDWDPAAGMIGFLGRLADWYVRAAEGSLVGADQPLHPPIAYVKRGTGQVVIRADLPVPADELWTGAAVLAQPEAARTEVVGWTGIEAFTGLAGGEVPAALRAAARGGGAGPFWLGPALVLPTPLTFEFPKTVGELTDALAARGVPPDLLTGLLDSVVRVNSLARAHARPGHHPVPLTVLVGAPMRGAGRNGTRQTHLSAWRLPPSARTLVSLRGWTEMPPSSGDRSAATLRSAFDLVGRAVADVTPVAWAPVHEQRPQIVTRRDTGRPASWVRGRRVAVLGCGALGARIAEHCLRAGAAGLLLADHGAVTPGILVRQPFEDRDIGRAKAVALRERLADVRPDVRDEIIAATADVITGALNADLQDLLRYDLIVDATANRSVAAHVEWARWVSGHPWPPILTVGVGHDCQRGIGVLALPEASGAGADVLHRFAVHALADRAAMADVVDDFFGPEPPDRFQPEPGCSAPTFRGADCDAAAMAAGLFAWAVAGLDDPVAPRSLFVSRLPPQTTGVPLAWDNDLLVADSDSGDYEIRIWPEALAGMRAEARRVPSGVETGGVLLGAIDDASRVVSVSWAAPPPPDSEHSRHYFRCGVEGVEQTVARHRARSGDRVRFLGLWHTHPGSPATMSATDMAAVRTLLVPVPHAPRRAVFLIAGGRDPVWSDWLENDRPPELHARLCHRVAPRPDQAPIAL